MCRFADEVVEGDDAGQGVKWRSRELYWLPDMR